MRKAIFWAFTALLVVVSCGKSDDGEGSNANLIGTWQLESIKSDGQTLQLDKCGLERKIVFYEKEIIYHHSDLQPNGECRRYQLDYKYTISGNNITYTNSQGSVTSNFSLQGDILTITTPASQSATNKEEVSIYRKIGADNNNTSTDPIIGNWKLKVLTIGQQSFDATKIPCAKDSYLNVVQNTMELYFAVKETTKPTCTETKETSQWKKENGKYYSVQNGQVSELPLQLLDNNETLQLTLSLQGQSIILSFRK